jgi:hypothetical protein
VRGRRAGLAPDKTNSARRALAQRDGALARQRAQVHLGRVGGIEAEHRGDLGPGRRGAGLGDATPDPLEDLGLARGESRIHGGSSVYCIFIQYRSPDASAAGSSPAAPFSRYTPSSAFFSAGGSSALGRGGGGSAAGAAPAPGAAGAGVTGTRGGTVKVLRGCTSAACTEADSELGAGCGS